MGRRRRCPTSTWPSATSTSARPRSASASRYAAARALHERGVQLAIVKQGPKGVLAARRPDARRGAAGAGRRGQRPRRGRRVRRRAVPRPSRWVGPRADACGSATRPVRSSPGGWRAPTRCPPRTRSRRSSQEARSDAWRTHALPRAGRHPGATGPAAIAEAAAKRRRPTSLLGDARPADDDRRRPPGPRRAAGRRAARSPWPTASTCSTGSCWRCPGPGVNGVLGTPDILEDLLLLGALDDKVVIGSMNRGGLAGHRRSRWTTGSPATTPQAIADAGFEGGKMLTRIDPDDPATVATLESCGRRGQRPGRGTADGDGRAVHLPPGRRPGPQRAHRRRHDPRQTPWRPGSAAPRPTPG